MGLKVKEGTAPKAVETEKAKAEGTAQIPVTESPAENYGVDSAHLTFLAPIVDPSQPDITKKDDGTEIRSFIVVGYKFVSDIDMEIPDVPTGDDLKANLMSYNPEKVDQTRLVKAGEEFRLTKFETGLLISQERFNGRCTGGDKPMVCSYTVGKSKGTNSTSQATAIPGIALRALTAGQSIKDYKYEECLSFTTVEVPTAEGKSVTRKKRTINAGFEKWAALAAERVRQPKPNAGTASDANKRNQGAQAFLSIVQKRK